MKIKDGCDTRTNDFWYDLAYGGYLIPEKMLENPEDVSKVEEARSVIRDFETSCEDQIEGFFL